MDNMMAELTVASHEKFGIIDDSYRLEPRERVMRNEEFC
jgi:hypothetical protein